MSGQEYTVMIYDDTDQNDTWLDESWRFGAAWARSFGGYDVLLPARISWVGVLEYLLTILGRSGIITRLDFWGHGSWGAPIIGTDWLRGEYVREDTEKRAVLFELGKHTKPDTLVWLRACSCFGNHSGQILAQELADVLGCRVAGHTYAIHAIHSGLHSVGPMETPEWNPKEGVKRVGNGEEPMWSKPWLPHTVLFTAGHVPKGW